MRRSRSERVAPEEWRRNPSPTRTHRQPPVRWPQFCWLCNEEALPQRAVCQVHAKSLEERGAHLRGLAARRQQAVGA
jgi:hypothetical protein